MSGSPQAETGTSVYCKGRRRRHQSRHDGAVAHLALLPAALPQQQRCWNLPYSPLVRGHNLSDSSRWDGLGKLNNCR
jgi:hypothetical protein